MAEQRMVVRLEADDTNVKAVSKHARDMLVKVYMDAGKSAEEAAKLADAASVKFERSETRATSAVERHIIALEKQAAAAGKSGVEKLIAARDQEIKQLGLTEAQIQRINASYNQMIERKRATAQATNELGERMRQFVAQPLQSLGAALGGVASRLGAVGIGLAAFGAAAGAASIKAVSLVSEVGDFSESLLNMSIRTGLGVEQLSKLSAMGKIAGVDIGTLERGARTLAERLTETSAEGIRAQKALREMGVSIHDTTGKQREFGVILLDMLKRLGGIQDQAQRLAAAHVLIGKGAVELQPLLRQYAELERAVEQAGLVWDEQMIRKLAAAADQVDVLKLRWNLLKAELAKPATAVVEIITRVVAAATSREETGISRAHAARGGAAGKAFRAPMELPEIPKAPGTEFAVRATAEARERGQELVRGAQLSEDFRRRRQQTLEGIKERIEAIQKEEQPIIAKLMAGDMTGTAVRQTEAQLAVLERERAALKTRADAIQDAVRHAEQQAKLAEKGRQQIEHFKRMIAVAARGGVEIVEPAKEGEAVIERRMAFLRQQFTTGLGAEREQIGEQLRNLKDVETEAKRGAEARIHALGREAQMHERLIDLQVGPGGELQAAEQIYQLRIQYAEQEFAIHQDRARFEDRMAEAQIDHITTMAQLERKRFEDLKRSAEGTIDALLAHSESVGKAILNILKTVFITPIKDTVSTVVANMLMPLYGGRAVGGGAGGWRGALGMAGVVGPVFGAGSITGGPGGTGGFAGPVEAIGGAAGAAGAYPAGVAGLGARFGLGAGAAGTLAAGGAALGLWGAYRMGQRGGLARGLAPAVGAVSGMLGFGALASMFPALVAAGPVGWIAAAGIGATVALIGMFRKSAESKAREKIRSMYQVEIREKGILQQIVETAKQGFGGDLDLAIRSPQIRDLIELYAISTGQPFGIASRIRPTTLFQAGGQIWQEPTYEYGRPITVPGPPVSLPNLVTPTATPAGAPQIVNVQIGSETVAQVIFQDGRVVKAVAAGMKANVSRREVLALQLAPGTLVT